MSFANDFFGSRLILHHFINAVLIIIRNYPNSLNNPNHACEIGQAFFYDFLSRSNSLRINQYD
jgi:hypothetical protein